VKLALIASAFTPSDGATPLVTDASISIDR
jgi:hypothetical protein